MNTGEYRPHLRRDGSTLHLIRPLGFDISDRAVKRAGLDYWHLVDLSVYDGLDAFFAEHPDPDLWLATTKAPRPYTEAEFRDGCWLFFGKETKGLPAFLRARYRDRCIRLPMRAEARSLNLANSVAVLAYEALRQTGFPGLLTAGEMRETGEAAHGRRGPGFLGGCRLRKDFENMLYHKKTVEDIEVAGKRVLLRCDFNVPLDPATNAITDDKRITASLPTIAICWNTTRQSSPAPTWGGPRASGRRNCPSAPSQNA